LNNIKSFLCTGRYFLEQHHSSLACNSEVIYYCIAALFVFKSFVFVALFFELLYLDVVATQFYSVVVFGKFLDRLKKITEQSRGFLSPFFAKMYLVEAAFDIPC